MVVVHCAYLPFTIDNTGGHNTIYNIHLTLTATLTDSLLHDYLGLT